MSRAASDRPELVVLLDETGGAVGTALKSGVHTAETPLHLAFSCYLLDDHGRVLLTRRAASKRTWPGAWTNSCCGHPAPGESLRDAVGRRVEDELGLAVTDLRLVLPAFRYRAVMSDGTVENEMCPVLVGRCPDPAAALPDPDEVADLTWLDWPGFRADVLAGRRRVSPWCTEQVAALPEALDRVPDDATGPGRLPPAVRL